MIVSQTPLRMSFVGGGSDLPAFYRRYGGAVISVTVDKYVYVTVNKKFDDRIRLSYSKLEEVHSAGELEHKIVRAALQLLKIDGGIEITSIADIPSRGTGLGSSSSFTVGLLHALHAYLGQYISPSDLGQQSCTVEIDLCGEKIGKQDQYAAAFGGLNLIQFHPDDSVAIDPIICQRDVIRELEASMISFYTGVTRNASTILATQSDQVEENECSRKVIRRMVDLTFALRNELHNNNLAAFGEILHENWVLKKSLVPGISDPVIDDWYKRARQAGALGGKLLGAGGGGFLMFFAPANRHEEIARALPDLRRFDIRFDVRGSRIIMFH
jgi:D-glycero-alpha-D-manno-heptose-7-phosphate kinase